MSTAPPEAGLLRCFRGIDTVTALTVLAELGDVMCFGSTRQLMSYLGASRHARFAAAISGFERPQLRYAS